MRIQITDGQRRIDIQLDGATPALLRQAERTARRLLADLAPPDPNPPDTEQQPFGYALASDTQLGPGDDDGPGVRR